MNRTFANIARGCAEPLGLVRNIVLRTTLALLSCGILGVVAKPEEVATSEVRAVENAALSLKAEVVETAPGTGKTKISSAAGEPAIADKADATDATAKKTLTEFGETYVLNSSVRSDVLNTEEYILEGQTPENWSQAITYQRIVFATPAAPDSLVGSIKKRIEELAPGSQLRLVSQGKDASIFAVHYAKTVQHEEQVAIALAAVADPKRPNELHLIQFALRPDRLDLSTMERLVKRWQARFQSQATSLNR